MTQETISQKSYIVGVNKESLLKDLSRNFYIILNKYVNPHHSRQKFWFPSSPDYDLDNGRLDYPIGTFEVLFNESRHTITRGRINATLSLEISATSASQRDDIADQVFRTIDKERYKTFWQIGIKKLMLDDSDNDEPMRSSELRIHTHTMSYTFQYVFDKNM